MYNIYIYIYIYSCRAKQFFGVVETVFFYLQVSFFLQKPLLVIKPVSNSRNEGFS